MEQKCATCYCNFGPWNFRYTDKNNKYGLNLSLFKENIAKQTYESYTEAISMLLRCDLPVELETNLEYIRDRINVLHNMISRYNASVIVDLQLLRETYISECLTLSLRYLEYLETDASETEIAKIENSLLEAIKKLSQAINQEIDNIVKYTSIEDIAKAKAIETLMTRDGYIDDKYIVGGIVGGCIGYILNKKPRV